MQIVGFIICMSRTIARYRNENKKKIIPQMVFPLIVTTNSLCMPIQGGSGGKLIFWEVIVWGRLVSVAARSKA